VKLKANELTGAALDWAVAKCIYERRCVWCLRCDKASLTLKTGRKVGDY
jgi:hypothetical protein